MQELNHEKSQWKAVEQLYRKGYSDTAIASQVGCSSEAIRSWRRRKGLRSNYTPPREQEIEVRNARMMELYRLGLDDGRISNSVCVSRTTVCMWRKKHGLPPNLPKGHPARVAIRLPTPPPVSVDNFHMTDDEILTSWRRAANQKQQVEILSQLNACSEEKMLAKLEALGLDPYDT